MRISSILTAVALAVCVCSAPLQGAAAAAKTTPCSHAGLKLPAGFCASVFADEVGHARHLTVAANGVVYVNTWSGRYFGNQAPHPGGFVVALQDTTSAGKANVIERFGPAADAGGRGGTGIALYKGALYVEESDRIERYALSAGSIVPQGKPEVIVSGLPLTGDHPMHSFVIDADGILYVDVATATNSCQARNRQPDVPGMRPCTELETRGGIWRYDANRTDQKFSSAERYATGIRNAEGMAIDPSGHGIWATQHGRDQLHENWPKLYKPEEEATQPAEELLKVKPGGDYGWPECYFLTRCRRSFSCSRRSTAAMAARRSGPAPASSRPWPRSRLTGHRMLSPSTAARASPRTTMTAPSSPFMDRGIAHPTRRAATTWCSRRCRAGRPQGGARFSRTVSPGRSRSRAKRRIVLRASRSRQTVLFISPTISVAGSIVSSNRGGPDAGAIHHPRPPADAPAGSTSAATAAPPEGIHPNAGGSAASLPVPPGSSRQMVKLGDEVFHGRVGGATCTGCHGSDAAGTPLGPNLTGKTWLWGDGSYASILKLIKQGVAQPKQYRSPMPPLGGAQLTPEQTSAVAAYVWALSHH